MAKVLSLWLLVMVTAITAQATTYSCRDKQGKLFITDNLQSLPAECRGRTQKVKSENPDNLNYVPAQAEPRGAGEQFQQQVRDVEREQEQQRERIENLLLRAEQLATQYKQAIQEKNNATRRWSYNSRAVIKRRMRRSNKLAKVKSNYGQKLKKRVSRGKMRTGWFPGWMKLRINKHSRFPVEPAVLICL